MMTMMMVVLVRDGILMADDGGCAHQPWVHCNISRGGADADTHGNAILTPRMFWCNTLQPRGISEDSSRFVSGGWMLIFQQADNILFADCIRFGCVGELGDADNLLAVTEIFAL